MIGGLALGLVLGGALHGAGHVAVLDERSVAELDGFVVGDGLVFDEAILLEVLLALLLLLRLEVGRVSCVAFLIVAGKIKAALSLFLSKILSTASRCLIPYNLRSKVAKKL